MSEICENCQVADTVRASHLQGLTGPVDKSGHAEVTALPKVALTEIVPASVRTVGFSLCYSLATALFGGFTPEERAESDANRRFYAGSQWTPDELARMKAVPLPDCTACDGYGAIGDHPCLTCGGNGKAPLSDPFEGQKS